MANEKKSAVPVLTPYNPLDKVHLGEQIAEVLLFQPTHRMPPEKFIGAGVYALYYIGDFPAYETLAEFNRYNQYRCPIYVGKAVPDGARKGGQGEEMEPGYALYKRLNDHAKSISQAENLNIEDFRCRYLAVDDIWIPLAETVLINRFRPVWNCLLEGFGNHAPGKGRSNMMMPSWDCFHPGRPWAAQLSPYSKSKEQLDAEIREYLKHLRL